MKFSLPAFALSRPITVIMISLSLLLVGGIAWFRMPLKFLPRVDTPVIGCFIPYPGGSPAQVEQQIAIPVEGEFRTIPGLRHIRSVSNSNGCTVMMFFNLDVDMTTATADVRDRMERLKLVLPDEVEHITLQRFSTGAAPILAFGLFQEGDQEEFTHRVRTIVQSRLNRLDGVAQVEVRSPIQEKNVLIEFDQVRLRSLNLPLMQVMSTLQQSNLNLSLGELPDGEKKYYVRLTGEYRRIEDIGALVVGPNALRLSDVATVRYSTTRSEEVFVSLDGKPGVAVLVVKESEANTVETCRAVSRELERLLGERQFSGTTMKLFFDQSDLISRALRNLLMEGLYGGAMALLVLFAFLHRILPTIVVALAIPTSLVVALVVMFFLKMELNMITMLSMIIAIGMLVDNAIVVVENTIRHRQLGSSPYESAKKGASEVALAIFAATVTTGVVFVPMYYLEVGQMSVLMQQLGMPLIVSLFGSLVIALTVIPLAMSRMKEPKYTNVFNAFGAWSQRKNTNNMGLLSRFFNYIGRLQIVQRTINTYSYCLRFSMHQRLIPIFVLLALGWLTFAVPMKKVGMQELPTLDTREIDLNITLDQNFDIDMARAFFSDIEALLEKEREELVIKNLLIVHEATNGNIRIFLYTEEDGEKGLNPPYSTKQAKAYLRPKIPERLPGAKVEIVVTESGDSGEGHGISLRMRGDDMSTLERHAQLLRDTLRNVDSISDVQTDIEHDKEEMQIKMDVARAEQAGITALEIGRTVEAALRGAQMPYMKQGTREVPVWLQFREEDRRSKANLDNVAIANQAGTLYPLHELVSYARADSPSSIRRINGKNVINISATTESNDLKKVRNDLEKVLDNFVLPVGYSIEFGDKLDKIEDTISQSTNTLLMAVILIYLVMSALFESFLLPLSILSSVPLALGGSVWMLSFTNSSWDTVTLIGNILMVGVIVNNGIVIVDHINSLRRKEGMNRIDAIVQAGRDRFRPVMMTAITTILGLVPLAMAKTGGASLFAGLGRALIGGLTVGTLLTLFVVPLFYTLLDDLQHWTLNFLANLAKLKKTTS